MSKIGRFDAIGASRVTGVSGGVLSAAAWVGGREEDLLDLMREAFRINDQHVSAGRPNFTPHEEIYRVVVSTTFDAEAIAQIADGPSFQCLVSKPPRWLPTQLAALVYAATYKVDELLRSSPQLIVPAFAGLEGHVIDAREAARGGRLVDLICACATIPPVFSVPRWDGYRIIDGALFNKVLLPPRSDGETLVLLTKRYRNTPQDSFRTYVQPSREVAADKIDFTDESKIVTTWQQGIDDAEEWLASGVC